MEEGTTFYLDSNVLIYAVINSESFGDKSRSILRGLHSGNFIAFTSCLALDEVLWAVRKIKQEAVIDTGINILNSDLKFIEVNKNILRVALDIIQEFNLKPRDAIPVATMKVHNIKNLVSEDSDFDKVNWINRKRINEFKL